MKPLALAKAVANPQVLCVRVKQSAYAQLFEEVWGEGSLNCAKDVSGVYERIGRSVAAYERSAEVNPYTSKFDKFWDAAKTLSLIVSMFVNLILIVAVVIVQFVRGQEIELLWAETLMIALAHYFTTRRFLNLPPDVIRRLAKEGHVEPEANPLFLPRFSIRLILLAIFAGLAIYLYQKNQLLDSPALPILGVVAAYVLGIMAGFRRVRWFEDLKAAVATRWMYGLCRLPEKANTISRSPADSWFERRQSYGIFSSVWPAT